MEGRRLWVFLSVVSCLLPSAFAEDAPSYTFGAPLQPGFVCSSAEQGNEGNRWMNGAFVASGGVATNVAVTAVDSDTTSQTKCSLVSAEVGFGWQRTQPDYYLADLVRAPGDVDWNATKTLYDAWYAEQEALGQSPGFLLNPDPNNPCVYAIAGGAQKFPWVLKDGTTNTLSYTIGATCGGRPRRIYWTDAPYNAPAVLLEGKFVRIFDNGGITKVERATVTNDVGGVQVVQENTVVSGIYIDTASQVMYAKGKPQGQFVLVYYDTGDYNNILCVEAIEAARPEAIACTGVIGQELKPTGLGYEIEGLTANVTAGIGDSDDDYGDYLYQHAGQESYSPKNKAVFPIRPSVGKRWKQEIYWMETDPMGVQWPFELDQYESDWPAHGYIYVRGDLEGDTGAKIYIPRDYTASLQSFQEPAGHAVQVDGNNAFYTTDEGWSLLKLTANDNIWFLPIHSVKRSNPYYFTLATNEVAVGQKIRLQGGSRSGLTYGAKELVVASDDAPGYLYRPASGGAYNIDLYYETTNATDTSSSKAATDTALPSALFPVNESSEALEVWWSSRVQFEDMPYWIDVPCLPQVFRPVWPGETEAPTIVLASQQGSAGESLFQQYGAATFDKSNARLMLLSRKYFPNGTGMVTFWTRPSKDASALDGLTNAPTALLKLGNQKGDALTMRIGADERFELLLGSNTLASVAMPKLARPNLWTHVALGIEKAAKFTLALNAEPVASGTLADAGFLAETLDQCVVGRAVEFPSAIVKPVIDDASVVTNVPQETLGASCESFAALKQSLEAGCGVKLRQNIEVTNADGDATISITSPVTLNLNGHSLRYDTDSDKPIQIRNGGVLTICDEAGGGVIAKKSASAVAVSAGGRLTLNGGTLKGGTITTSQTGGVVRVEGGTFDMNGGTIRDGWSNAANGGGIDVCAGGVFTQNGGLITGCQSGNGGGICVETDGTFTMNGGRIEDCESYIGGWGNRGGGVCVYGRATINGGRITGCRALTGGGLMAASGSFVTVNRGLIASNQVYRAQGSAENNYCLGGGIAIRDGTCVLNGGFIVANKALANTGDPAQNRTPRHAAIGGYDGARFVMNGGAVLQNVCENGNTPMGMLGGSIVLTGGLLDFEPLAENVNAEGLGTFDEPIYMANDKLKLYRIALGTAVGRQVSEIIFRSELLSASSIEEARYKILTGVEQGVSGYYSFRPGQDLVSIVQKAAGADFRRFWERTTGIECLACNVILETPGAPGYHPCIIGADATPSVYYQNVAGLAGYNPNEEHAFVKAGSGGYVAWALRGDLNTDGASKPAVLVEYEKDGEARMQFLHVAITNAAWPRLAGTCTVAQMLPGPQPITLMDDPWLPEDYWDRDPQHPDKPGVAYRDRKGQLWARCAGTLPIYMYYRMQDGFWFPQFDLANQPAAGTPIPWLSLVANPKALADPVHVPPAVWTWEAEWPENYNEMKIGQTLYAAADGLPGVYNMTSASVVYPTRHEESGPTETVALVDPTVEQSVTLDLGSAGTVDAFLKLLGLSTDPNGGLNMRKGMYYFNELPPHLASRVWVDASSSNLCLVGKYDKKNAGASILYVNVLSASEHAQLRNVVPESMRGGAAWETWCAATDALGAKRVEPNDMRVMDNELKTTYSPRDSYALAAVGNTNWVVLVENDAPTTNETRVVDGVATTVNLGVNAGDAINMHVFRVVPQYYAGRIVTKEDEQNLLSQRLTVMYSESFGGESDQYVFEWKSASPNDDGTIPENYDDGPYVKRAGFADSETPRLTIGEQGDTLANMVNKYWICRYKAKDASCPAYGVMGDAWSAWCAPPALAEGWVQRVLNNVTPFNQLMTDLYENPTETAVSMLQKAGKPYTGDVALNQDALTDCGLIELYETMFNKAESMSLLLNVKDSEANKQLLLVAERLGDLYTVLGDEAYSDAKNPTIGFGNNIASVENQPSVDFGAASSGLFCFDNQVRTLLDEELALLRGRSAESAPYVTKHLETGDRRVMNTAPYYNRLLWNFTKGITAGEVAYAVNYNVGGTQTTALGEEQAAALYPQGHGDAYGHYLSALKGWYRLLRNPNFNWVRAQGEMNVADSSVNVDYYEEAKFAEAALKVARTAADVVDLTARKAYDEDGAKLAGYMDENEERAFGYGEWANRGGYGTLVNWAVANSVLPEDAATVTTGVVDGVVMTFRDEGLARIDRGTVDELAELCAQAAAIQAAEDRIDAGLNPLGLNADTIPFDLSPIGANDGTLTHYEQIRERAGTAMANARAILERAQDYASRLTMVQEGADDYVDQIEEQELDYNQELIGYYGTPYSDDIGPGKTYEQGYEGPDTVHYMWMDISKFNLTNANMRQTSVTVKEWTDMNDIRAYRDMLKYFDEKYEGRKPLATEITLDLSSVGIVIKPANITGTRTMQGSIQEKYADFLLAYKDYCSAIWTYDDAISKLKGKTYALNTLFNMKEARQALEQVSKAWEAVKAGLEYAADTKIEILQTVLDDGDSTVAIDGNCANLSVVAGTACGSNPQGVINKILADGKKTLLGMTGIKRLVLNEEKLIYTLTSAEYNSTLGIYDAAINETETNWEYGDKVRELINAINNACWDAQAKSRAVQVAIEAYKSEVAKAEQVLEKREANRKKYVNKIAQWRYNDMFFRQLRNQALTRYTVAFDLAQKYVWEAAKAYGYETGLLDDEEGSGASFLNQIIGSRSLGSFDGDGNPVVGDVGDTGLSGLLAQMDANWLVLKPRLGINNPQEYATWFSLRSECFRILPDSAGDAAWSKELTKYWVDDITSNADFLRYCQPFQSQYGLKDKEPGLIIPFETTIDFAKNFFGNDLAGEDNAYDSTWYATRICAAGLWFDGYNAKAEDYAGKAQLANTPVAYLVPMGTDCMRVPGLEDGEVLGFNVVDQVIAAPYAIGSQHLNDLSWFPCATQGDLGGADATTKIRKHPSFRAYFDTEGGEPTDDALDCTRLVGRSVWNTRWMLVIPAGGMNADREKALSVFINGSDVNRDGKLDLMPVSDIRIGFRTYSNSGN